jgi:hypothetical protein
LPLGGITGYSHRIIVDTINKKVKRPGSCWLTFEFTGLRGFSRRSGGMRG